VVFRESLRCVLLLRIHFIIVMIRWTGLAPWEFKFPFPGKRLRCVLAGEVRFRGGLVSKAHRRVYHSTLGLKEIKKKEDRVVFRERLRSVLAGEVLVRGVGLTQLDHLCS